MSLYFIKNVAKAKEAPKESRKSAITGKMIKRLISDGSPLINNRKIAKTIKFSKKDKKDTKHALIINIPYLKFIFFTIPLLETIEFNPKTVLSEKKFHKIIPRSKNNEYCSESILINILKTM